MVSRTLVPKGILVQIQLVVVLCIPPLASLEYLSRHLPAVPLLIHLGGDFFCNLLLLRVVIENGTAVLCARVISLPIERSRIVRAVEELDQLCVGDFCWIVNNLGGFGICPQKKKKTLSTPVELNHALQRNAANLKPTK